MTSRKPLRRIEKMLSLMFLALVMLLQIGATALAENAADGVLVVEDGMMQPILQFSNPPRFQLFQR